MITHAVAGLALAATLATGAATTSCQPTDTATDAHSVVRSAAPQRKTSTPKPTRTVPPRTANPKPPPKSRYEQCDPGWVCGTCPDGKWWGYLDDPKYTDDPQLRTLIFDNRKPCG